MNKPLAGKRILITRSHEQAAALAKPLEDLGAEVISIPAIEFRPPQSFQPLDKALHIIDTFDWLILTSTNGVRALRRRLEKTGKHSGALRHLQVAAIGPSTKGEAEQFGLKVSLMPDEYIAESVVSAMKDKVKGKRVLLVRAKVARDVIPNELRAAGAEVEVAEAYETVVPRNSAEKLKEVLADTVRRPHALTFTSSSTVKNFVTLLGQGVSPKQALQDIILASIGPVTSETLKEVGLCADIEAREFTIPGLVEALAAHLKS